MGEFDAGKGQTRTYPNRIRTSSTYLFKLIKQRDKQSRTISFLGFSIDTELSSIVEAY